MYAKEFLIINKALAQLNKGNKQVLQSNARATVIFASPTYISDKADETISRIVKKVSDIKSDETLLSRVLTQGNPENTPCDECIKQIEDNLENLEHHITPDMSMDQVMSNIQNFTSDHNHKFSAN